MGAGGGMMQVWGLGPKTCSKGSKWALSKLFCVLTILLMVSVSLVTIVILRTVLRNWPLTKSKGFKKINKVWRIKCPMFFFSFIKQYLPSIYLLIEGKG